MLYLSLVLCQLLACGANVDSGASITQPDDTFYSRGGALYVIGSTAKTAPRGMALLTVHNESTTTLSFQATELAAGEAYSGTLYAQPCDTSLQHPYAQDPTLPSGGSNNQMTVSTVADTQGVLTAELSLAHAARGDALSLVINDSANDLILCADLQENTSTTVDLTAEFILLSTAESFDQSIVGQMSASRGHDLSFLQLDVMGLDSSTSYTTLIHDLPCDLYSSSGAYVSDPSQTATLSNIVAIELGVDAMGVSSPFMSLGHRLRSDAQSIVLYRQAATGEVPVACGDISVVDYPDFVAQGSAYVLPNSPLAQLDNFEASVRLTRKSNGFSYIRVLSSGLPQNTSYTARLIEQGCSYESQSSPYAIDSNMMSTNPNNNLQLSWNSGSTGSNAAVLSHSHLTRAEGIAVVIENMTGERFGCADLYVE